MLYKICVILVTREKYKCKRRIELKKRLISVRYKITIRAAWLAAQRSTEKALQVNKKQAVFHSTVHR